MKVILLIAISIFLLSFDCKVKIVRPSNLCTGDTLLFSCIVDSSSIDDTYDWRGGFIGGNQVGMTDSAPRLVISVANTYTVTLSVKSAKCDKYLYSGVDTFTVKDCAH